MKKKPEEDKNLNTKTRRPYVAPAVLSEEVFETLALSCASVGPFQCPIGNANS